MSAPSASDSLFASVFGASPLAIHLIRLSDGTSLVCNAAYTRLTGYTADELMGKTAEDVSFFMDPQVRASWMERLRLEGQVLNQEAEVRTKFGEVRDVLASLSLVDVDGEPTVMIVATDVTARRQADGALRRSEERFRHVFESANVGKSITLLDGTISVNQAFADWLGYTRDELVGKTWQELTPSEEIPRILGILEPLTRGERDAARFTKPYVRKDGALVWGDVSVTLQRDEAGAPLYFLTTIVDVTERRQTAEELARSEERLRLSTELAGVAVWEYDFTTNTMSRSRNHDRLYGLEWQEVWRLDTFLQATHPDDRERSNRIISEAVAPGGPDRYEFDFRVVTPTGEIRWLSVVGQVVLRAPDGRGVTVRGSLQDITTRKTAEEALRRSEERFQLAFHSSPAGLTITRVADGRFTEVNQSFLDMFGFRREEVIGRTSTELGMWTPEQRSKLIEMQLATGGLRGSELVAFSKSGTPVDILFSSAPIDIDGELHHVTTMVDITSRRAAEAELRRMNTELEMHVRERTVRLEAAIEELSAFTYSVSHDLRAPIRGIDGWTAILALEAGTSLDARAQEHLARIRGEARRMGRLIDDLLRLSRIGTAELHVTQVDLSAMAEGIAARLRGMHPHLVIQMSIEAGLAAPGDPALLEVALENLLSNAIKFSGTRPAACVSVGRRQGTEPCFFVKDEGVGFPSHLADRLFRPFTRLHSEDEFSGTGVGLATVARIVRRHGGRVWAESEADRGATFCFTLPDESDHPLT